MLLFLNCSLRILSRLFIINYILIPQFPVVTAPIEGVILKMLVTVYASISLSPTLFSVITTQESFPLIPTEVKPDNLTA